MLMTSIPKTPKKAIRCVSAIDFASMRMSKAGCEPVPSN
jgi:hypothetical protein